MSTNTALQSILIIGGDDAARLEKAELFCNTWQIDALDRIYIVRLEQPGKEGKRKASLGIDDVKTLQKKLAYKPLHGTQKAIIIPEAHLLTVEAQNALLKVLEEPPPHTLFLLLTPAKEIILPTIISRCKLVMLPLNTFVFSTEEEEQFAEITLSLAEWGRGRALKQAELLSKDNEAAHLWLEKCIIMLRKQAMHQIDETHNANLTQTLRQLKTLQTVKNTLATTNANPRLLFEACFLSLLS